MIELGSKLRALKSRVFELGSKLRALESRVLELGSKLWVQLEYW